MKKILSSVLCVCGLAGASAFADDLFYAGTHVGALGVGSESKIGYGLHLGANPYGWAAFQMDATFASLNKGTYFSSSPSVVLYPVNYEEFLIGVMAGAGFYKFPTDNVRFGLSFGAAGDFKLTKLLSVGMMTRYHSVFGATDNAWDTMLTLRFHFEGDGGW